MENTLYLTVVVMMATVSTVTAIKCFSCSTAIDGATCGDKDGFTNTKTESSLANQPCQMCIKFKAEANGVEFVQRSCLPTTVGMTSGDCKSQSQGGYSGDICYCSGDLCNSGQNVYFSKTLLVISMVLSASVYILWK